MSLLSVYHHASGSAGQGALNLPCDALLGAQQDQVLAESVEKIENSTNPQEVKAILTETSIRLAQLEADDLVASHQDRLAELERLVLEGHACDRKWQCRYLKLKKLMIHISQIRSIIYKTLRLDRKTERLIQKKIAELRSAEATMGLTYKLDQAQRLKSRFSISEMLAHFSTAAQSFGLQNLRASPEALRDWKKVLKTVFSFQIFGQGANVAHLYTQEPQSTILKTFFSDPSAESARELTRMLSETTQWAVFLNTFVMVTLQSDQGARNQKTDFRVKPSDIQTVEGLIHHLPAFIQGEAGFSQDTRKKIMGFVALLPFEWAVMNAMKAIQVGVNEGWSGLSNPEMFFDSITVNLLSLGIFGSYLAVRWSVLDKVLNLSLIPLYREGLKQELQKSWEDFQTLAGPLAETRDHKWFVRVYNASAEGVKWQRRWPARLRSLFQSADVPVEGRNLALNLMNSPEGDRLIRAHYANLRGLHREVTWRVGIGMFDAWFVFGLFGQWIPQIVERLF